MSTRSGYSKFCQTRLLSGSNIKNVGIEWNLLSAEEKHSWKMIANTSTILEPAEKKKRVRKFVKNIDKMCHQLHELGASIGGAIKVEADEVRVFGDPATQARLANNDHFLAAFVKPDQGKESLAVIKGQLQKKVREIFNSKYSAAIGKRSRMNYAKSTSFHVVGLPEGIDFKRPSHYGISDCKKILENCSQIAVILHRNATVTTSCDDEVGNEHSEVHLPEMRICSGCFLEVNSQSSLCNHCGNFNHDACECFCQSNEVLTEHI